MAAPSNAYKVASASAGVNTIVGVREDLADVIYDISPMDTPVMSAGGRSTAEQQLTEWQMHTLAAFATPDGTPNANIEGDSAVNDTPVFNERLNNRVQIFDKVIEVTDIAERVRKAGRTSERRHEMFYRMRELKRDIEAHISQNSAIIDGTNSVAGQTGSLETWMGGGAAPATDRSTGATPGAAAAGLSTTVHQPTHGSGNKPTDGTQRDLTETIFRNVISKGFTNGTNFPLVVAGPVNKQKIDGFAGNSTPTLDAASQMRVATFSVYVSFSGRHKVVPSRFSRERSVLFLDPEYYDLAYLQDFYTIDLGRSGPSLRTQVLASLALRNLNPDAHGVAADLTTT